MSGIKWSYFPVKIFNWVETLPWLSALSPSHFVLSRQYTQSYQLYIFIYKYRHFWLVHLIFGDNLAIKAKNFWIFVSFTSDRLSYFVKRLRPVGCSTVCSSQLQLCGASQKKRKSQNKKAIKAKKKICEITNLEIKMKIRSKRTHLNKRKTVWKPGFQGWSNWFVFWFRKKNQNQGPEEKKTTPQNEEENSQWQELVDFPNFDLVFGLFSGVFWSKSFQKISKFNSGGFTFYRLIILRKCFLFVSKNLTDYCLKAKVP